MNMILKLQKYDCKLVYLPGKKNVVADALSCTLIAKKNMKEIKEAIKKKEIGPREWKLSEEVKQAILALKEVLVKEPVLRLPNFNKLFEIQTNMLKYMIGSVLY